MHHGKRARRVEIIAERLDHLVWRRRGRGVPRLQKGAVEAGDLGPGLPQQFETEVEGLAVVGAEKGQAQDLARPVPKEVLHGVEVAQRLGHLLAVDGHKAVVHPDPGKSGVRMCRTGLGNLVLVVWKDKVVAAAMDVEVQSEMAGAHGGALEVPARTPVTPGTLPSGKIARGRFPEHEVGITPLVGSHIQTGSGNDVLHRVAGEPAIVRP